METSIHQGFEQKLHQADKKLRGAAKRMLWQLYRYGPSHTGELSAAIACSNLSDCASRANRVLEPLGLRIVCHLPKQRLRNRFNEPSMSHLWKLVVVR